MVQRQQRAVAVRPQRDLYPGFPFRRRTPPPAQRQSLVRHHLAIDAGDFVMLAILHLEADPVAAADPRIDVGPYRAGDDLRGPEPSGYFFRVGPRRVDFRRRGIETTFEREARSGDETGDGA